MNNQIIYSPTYRNYPINTQNGTMGCYDKTLEKIYNILLGANKRHARIIVVRFDLHYPLNMIPPQDNHLFSNMMRNFMEKLGSQHLSARKPASTSSAASIQTSIIGGRKLAISIPSPTQSTHAPISAVNLLI